MPCSRQNLNKPHAFELNKDSGLAKQPGNRQMPSSSKPHLKALESGRAQNEVTVQSVIDTSLSGPQAVKYFKVLYLKQVSCQDLGSSRFEMFLSCPSSNLSNFSF
jgi:hypothetical protein